MSAVTISCPVRFTCFLVVAVIAAFLSNTVNADLTYPRPPSYFDDAPASLKRVQPHIDPSAPLIRCYCNLPECLTATDNLPFCHTRQGCFTRIQMNVSELTGPSQVADPTTNTTTTIQPVPDELDESLTISRVDHVINGAFGCLELLPFKQTCEEMLQLTEFPTLPTANSPETVYAYHCCQKNMCNDRDDPATITTQEAQEVQEALRKTFQSSFQQNQSKRAAEVDLETMRLAPYTITDVKTVPVNPDAVAPKVATDINAEAEPLTNNIENTKQEIGAIINPTIKKCVGPDMCSKSQNTASADHSKTLKKNEKMSASEESFKVMQWMASLMLENFEKTAPTEITKTPNTMQFPSTTPKDESSQRNTPIFVAPEMFPTKSEYPPIYYRKTNLSIADFITIINIVKSLKPKANGFSGRHSHLNEDRKIYARTIGYL